MTDPLTYRSPKTEIRESRIHGRGLFARVPIRKGELVAMKGGYVLQGDRWKGLEPVLGAAEIQVGDDLFMAPLAESERDGAMLFSNHSCDPNIGIQGQIAFVAMRDILADEELTHDWATNDDSDYELACRCAGPQCRGTISGRDWMRPELQAKYRGWFCWFLQRKIDELSKDRRSEDTHGKRP